MNDLLTTSNQEMLVHLKKSLGAIFIHVQYSFFGSCVNFHFLHVITQGGKLTVEVIGSSGVAAAWGLHHYLQQYCGAQVHYPC